MGRVVEEKCAAKHERFCGIDWILFAGNFASDAPKCIEMGDVVNCEPGEF
jgi:hypothetical protein